MRITYRGTKEERKFHTGILIGHKIDRAVQVRQQFQYVVRNLCTITNLVSMNLGNALSGIYIVLVSF